MGGPGTDRGIDQAKPEWALKSSPLHLLPARSAPCLGSTAGGLQRHAARPTPSPALGRAAAGPVATSGRPVDCTSRPAASCRPAASPSDWLGCSGSGTAAAAASRRRRRRHRQRRVGVARPHAQGSSRRPGWTDTRWRMASAAAVRQRPRRRCGSRGSPESTRRRISCRRG